MVFRIELVVFKMWKRYVLVTSIHSFHIVIRAHGRTHTHITYHSSGHISFVLIIVLYVVSSIVSYDKFIPFSVNKAN